MFDGPKCFVRAHGVSSTGPKTDCGKPTTPWAAAGQQRLGGQLQQTDQPVGGGEPATARRPTAANQQAHYVYYCVCIYTMKILSFHGFKVVSGLETSYLSAIIQNIQCKDMSRL